MTVSDPKHELRKRILDRMRSLSVEERRRSEASVHEALRNFVRAHSVRSIFAYLADGEELSLDPVISEWIAAGIQVATPRVGPNRGRMEAAALSSLRDDDLHTDRYGLRSPPPEAPVVATEALELVIVPGVAFTLDGARLGRGGGYYDRWLASLPSKTPRVGVCHAVQVVDVLSVESHDLPVHRVVAGSAF